MKVLVTCPPMLGMMEQLHGRFAERGITVTCPMVTQTLSEADLLRLVPEHDGWVIGDDPATHRVLTAGRAGRLRATVKWGIGIDNVDTAAIRDLGLPFANTPGMFGNEVADIALGYVIALARETFLVDRGVRAGRWPKPRGISLYGKTVALVGYGDIGRHAAPRFAAAGLRVIVYDPGADPTASSFERAAWPARLGEADFIVITCALTASSHHLLNRTALQAARRGVRVVNVSRGPVIDEPALIDALASGHVHSAALDVFEVEPLPAQSPLRRFERCILGSHNASNTEEAVLRTSERAIETLLDFLDVPRP